MKAVRPSFLQRLWLGVCITSSYHTSCLLCLLLRKILWHYVKGLLGLVGQCKGVASELLRCHNKWDDSISYNKHLIEISVVLDMLTWVIKDLILWLDLWFCFPLGSRAEVQLWRFWHHSLTNNVYIMHGPQLRFLSSLCWGYLCNQQCPKVLFMGSCSSQL